MIGAIPRRGALLPIVLVVMVIIALAAGAALFASHQERRASWNRRLQTTALAAADGAPLDAIPALARGASALPYGASIARRVSAGDGVETTARLTRLGPTLFSLLADADARSPLGLSARRSVSLLLRLDPPSLDFPAALNVVGAAAPEPSLADGVDEAPNGWPCASTAADSAPTRHPSPAPDSSVLAELRRRAGLTVPAGATLSGVRPVVLDGVCATEIASNWGDPDRGGPCASWLPVIHAAGDLTVDGGAGQGTLLVDGDLMIGGGFRFVGAVIVTGAIDVGAGGASLVGGVIAGRVRDGSGSAGPEPIVHRSTCALAAALVAAGALVPVIDRAWMAAR